MGWIEDQIAAAETTRALGDQVGARAIMHENLEIARRWDSPGPIGQALRGVARIDSESDSDPAAARGERVAGGLPARLEYARALADGLSATARQQLAASGARVRRPALGDADELTASERRIYDMASAGLSTTPRSRKLCL